MCVCGGVVLGHAPVGGKNKVTAKTGSAATAKMDAFDKMTPLEHKAARSLASIYSLRMLGLFMILPVFSLYADELEGVTPFLIGVAIGVYGLTQAAFQIPMGMLSDRIGRKPVIAAGLLIFALGSVVAAMADSMTGVIIGRALQGSGAIAAAIMALAADLTREEQRVKVMATIGVSIGLSFAVALVGGPILDAWIGVDGIFWLTAVLAIGGIFVLYHIVPTPAVSKFHRDAEPIPEQFKVVLRDPELLRLDAGIFILHMVLTSSFVVLPFALRDYAGLAIIDHWWVYLPVLVISMIIMIPFVIVAEKHRKMKSVFIGSVAVLALAEMLLMIGYHSLPMIFVALFLFFIAFNVLEATLPSLIAKTAPPHIKGTAMGVYSSAQFLGAFVGGISGGMIYGGFGLGGVFMFAMLGLLLWLFLAITMKNPRYLATFMIHIGPIDEQRSKQLVKEITAITGVAEVIIIAEDEIAYLKVDNHALNKEDLIRFHYVAPNVPTA